MNTQVVVHPRLQHIGLVTSKLEPMLDWYHKVVGMAVHRRVEVPDGAGRRAPFSAVAFVGNDEVHHRLAIFEVPAAVEDPDKLRHKRLQHIAFQYGTLDDLLSTYARLKSMSVFPVMAADEGVGTSFYYVDPDQNNVELNIDNYGDPWTTTEAMMTLPSLGRREIDPDKMIEARRKGLSPWEVHERAAAGEFAPSRSYAPAGF